MAAFAEWLRRVTEAGESVQPDPPNLTAAERPAVEDILRAAYHRHALSVAGEPVPCDVAVGGRAAVAVANACWRLTADDDTLAVTLGRGPATTAAHLSADVCLRFLPAVYRRAVRRAPESALVSEIAAVFRAWPLSGVLADLDGEPTTPPTFDTFGLRLLYAERLAAVPRPGWLPADDAGREVVERVFYERKVPVPSR